MCTWNQVLCCFLFSLGGLPRGAGTSQSQFPCGSLGLEVPLPSLFSIYCRSQSQSQLLSQEPLWVFLMLRDHEVLHERGCSIWGQWNFWIKRERESHCLHSLGPGWSLRKPLGGELGRVQVCQLLQAMDSKWCYMWFLEVLISLMYTWVRAESQTGLVSWSCHPWAAWPKAK